MKKKITIKFWVLSGSNWGLPGDRSVYHPLLYYRGFLKNGTRIHNFKFLSKNQLCKTVENEFYNIKSRLHLGLFSVKILLLSSFALAAMIFQKFDHVVKTK